MTVKKISTGDVEKTINDHSEPCLVAFSRENCPVCQEVMPRVEDLSQKFADKLSFFYVDVEEDKSILKKYFLKGVPQLLFFKDGELRGKLSGNVEDEEIEEIIAEII